MARRKTLGELLRDLRVEARLSLLPAHNVQMVASHTALLQAEQERLWDEFDWPHLRVERTFPIEVGQYLYENPADLDIERIEKVEFKSGGAWLPVVPGIGAEQYAAHDSALDQRGWPVRRWRIREDDMIELWPAPDDDPVEDTQEGYVKLTGIRKLSPLVEDSDLCDLDARMIVLYVAGQVLAATGAKDAQLKIQMADQRKAQLTNRASPRQPFVMLGATERPVQRRKVISHYIPPST